MSNLARLLEQHRAYPEKILYRQHIADAWQDFSVRDVMALAARWQQAFRSLGYERGDRVALCLRNGVDWVAIDQAALGLGLVVVPLYVDDNPQNLAWCLADSGARLLVLENTRLLAALTGAMQAPPAIVCLHGEVPAPAISAGGWLPESGGPFEVSDLDERALATIVYTSGTTGRPKGVMLSMDNVLVSATNGNAFDHLTENEEVIAYLPLAWVGDHYLNYAQALVAAFCLACPESGETVTAEGRSLVLLRREDRA